MQIDPIYGRWRGTTFVGTAWVRTRRTLVLTEKLIEIANEGEGFSYLTAWNGRRFGVMVLRE